MSYTLEEADRILSARLKAEGYPQCSNCGIQLGPAWRGLMVNRWPCCGDAECRQVVRRWALPI